MFHTIQVDLWVVVLKVRLRHNSWDVTRIFALRCANTDLRWVPYIKR